MYVYYVAREKAEMKMKMKMKMMSVRYVKYVKWRHGADHSGLNSVYTPMTHVKCLNFQFSLFLFFSFSLFFSFFFFFSSLQNSNLIYSCRVKHENMAIIAALYFFIY